MSEIIVNLKLLYGAEAIVREADKCCTTITSTSAADDNNNSQVTSTSSNSEPPTKKVRSTLFASYERRRDSSVTRTSPSVSIRSSVLHYLEIVEQNAAAAENPWAVFKSDESVRVLHPLLERVFSVPASSAPVERVFSQSGLMMRPNRSRLSKNMLSQLVFLKCNRHLP